MQHPLSEIGRPAKKERQKRDKYNRIPLKTKLILFHKVLGHQADLDDVFVVLSRPLFGLTSKNRPQKL